MKKATLAIRILLGLMFLIFGVNNILHFFHMPMPTGDAGLFVGILATHGYLTFVSVVEIIGGLLLVVGRYVPLGLVLLTPIIVNILLYHGLLDPSGIGAGLLAALLDVVLLWAYRLSFRGLFDAAPEVS